MARVAKIPMVGRMIIFAAQTDRKAKTGRSDPGRSLISIRANDTPKRNKVMGTVIPPMSLAFHGQADRQKTLRRGVERQKNLYQSRMPKEASHLDPSITVRPQH